jgi:hypothetical protein
MKLFSCSACGQVVFFENVKCTKCGHTLAYLPDRALVSALEPAGSAFRALAAGGAVYRLCRNSTEHAACNWAIPESTQGDYCFACSFNEVVPNLADEKAKDEWRKLERAKRRLFYTLMGLGLPLESRQEDNKGLGFAFKQDSAGEKVFTGHSDGLITINIAEADDPFREKMRQQMGEAYRTVLGHFRHEIGHYFELRLVDLVAAGGAGQGSPRIEGFRAVFGDEQQDYQAALDRNYKAGAPADWPAHFVSPYASMHPYEDFAETWAHYLHMVETLETARSYGLALRPRPVGGAKVADLSARRLDFDDFDDLMTGWVPLTLALNSLNRAMGMPDLYPFVLTDAVRAKLRFVHDLIEKAT